MFYLLYSLYKQCLNKKKWLELLKDNLFYLLCDHIIIKQFTWAVCINSCVAIPCLSLGKIVSAMSQF